MVLDRLYGILLGAGQNRADVVTSTLLGILDSRMDNFEQNGIQPTVADTVAIDWLIAQVRRGNNRDMQIDVARRAARLMADATLMLVRGRIAPAHKAQIEEAAVHTESQLSQLLPAIEANAQPPATSLAAAVLAPAGERETKLTATLTTWIGSADEAGVLNKAPFNFPQGLEHQDGSDGADDRPRPALETGTAQGGRA